MQAISHLCLEKKLWKKTQSVMQVWMGKVCDQTRMAHAEGVQPVPKTSQHPLQPQLNIKNPFSGGFCNFFAFFQVLSCCMGRGGVEGVCPVTCMLYVAQPKHCMVCFPNYSSFIHFLHSSFHFFLFRSLNYYIQLFIYFSLFT